MKSLAELKVDLKAVRQQIKEYAGLQDFSDEDHKQLAGLKDQALKLDAQITAREEVAKLEADEQAERDADVKRQIAEGIKAEREKLESAARRLPMGVAPHQSRYGDTNKYDGLDAVDLSLLISMEQALKMDVQPGALKAMSLRVGELKDTDEQVRQDNAYVKQAFKAATNIDPEMKAIESAVKAATDPMYSGGSSIGSDWVGTLYSTELWRAIRAANRVVANIPSEVIPDGYSSKTWPLESTDMTWYKVSEATASDGTLKVPAATVTASQMATANKNITTSKIGSRGIYTGELEEDSLIRFSAQLRTQLQASGSEILESLVIDGDTETSASKNINDIAGTPAATDYFLSFDGFRKLALVTNTANSASAEGGLDIEDFLDLLKLMGTAGLAGSDPSKVNFIVDGNVYYAMAKLPEVKTKDVNSAATVENGFVTQVYNVGVIPSWQMHRGSTVRKANTAGKIDLDTVGNNTTGAVLAVRWDQWKMAYKRRMTMEMTRIPNADSWEIVALARLGLGYRDTEASAILYNVGV
jgi:hypothetical protein